MDKRPALTADRWVCEDEPEFIPVRSGAIADIARASRSIAAIGRILHNAVGDDDNETSSLDNWTKQNLAGAVECLSEYIYDFVEDIGFTASQIRRWEAEEKNG